MGGEFDMSLVGAQKLEQFGARLKQLGDGKELRKDLVKGLNTAARPMKKEVAAGFVQAMPGGLGPWVAKRLRMNVKNRLSGSLAGVRLKFSLAPKKTGTSDLNALNRGRARAPLFGHGPWHVQAVRSGTIQRVMKGPVADRARSAVVEAVKEALRKIHA